MFVLVTGSSGHLGKAIIRTLLSRQSPPEKQPLPDLQQFEPIGIDILEGDFTDHVGNISDAAFLRNKVFGSERIKQNKKKRVVGIINTAVLHKPHIASHSRSQFVDVNIAGVTTLFECFREYLDSQEQQRRSEEEEKEEQKQKNEKKKQNTFFIQTSTTSTYGNSFVSHHDDSKEDRGRRVTWITEQTIPSPKNIYGVTKRSAEDLCELFAKEGLVSHVFVLQASRFFPEADDELQRAKKFRFGNDHQHIVELFHRRVEIQDLVDVHLLAAKKAVLEGADDDEKEENNPTATSAATFLPTQNNKNQTKKCSGKFARYLCSAPTPFILPADLDVLSTFSSEKIEALVAQRVGEEVFSKFRENFPNWKFPDDAIDRVYDSSKAVKELEWNCNFTPAAVMKRLVEEGKKESDCLGNFPSIWKSDLAREVGVKGYFRE